MKYTNLKAFSKQLESSYPKHLAPVYVVLTEDDEEMREALALLNRFLEDQGQEKQVFDGPKVDPKCLYEEIHSLSLFSRQKIVHIKAVEDLKTEQRSVIEEAIVKPQSGIKLVLSGSALSAATNLFKKAEKAGIILDLSSADKPWEKEQRMTEWIIEELKGSKKAISAASAQFFVQTVGPTKALLRQEIEKLLCFTMDKGEISKSDIERICIKQPHQTVWQFSEAVLTLHAGEAMRFAKNLMEEGLSLLALLPTLRRQFQTTLQISSILTSGGGANEVAQQFPYMKGKILSSNIERAQNYGQSRLIRGLIEIDKFETEAKNSGTDHELILEILVAKLCAKYV